jgi:hypothetical protein
MEQNKTHLFIPDTQVRDGVDLSHLKALGKLVVKRKPDVIVFIGDHWDFPSLSTHTPSERIAYEQKTYMKDLEAGIKAMELFLAPLEKYNEKQKANKKKQYTPMLVFTCGNHEYRVDRLVEQQPVMEGLLPRCEDYLRDKGFLVIPYKQKTVIDGINYSHLCPQTSSAGAVSRAHLIMQKRNSSWSVGHSQIFDYHVSPHHPRLQCLILGAFYTHDEGYKEGSNDHWRGCVFKHNVKDGTYDPEFISIDRLLEM